MCRPKIIPFVLRKILRWTGKFSHVEKERCVKSLKPWPKPMTEELMNSTNRLTMEWNGVRIVDLSRSFLNSNGAAKHTDVEILPAAVKPVHSRAVTAQDVMEHMGSLNLCSQKGLSERFDSTIGAGTVLMPFGGKNQLTPIQAMVQKISVEKKHNCICTTKRNW